LTLRVNQSLAKTAASVNYPSARLPRLTQIDAPFSSRLSRDTRSTWGEFVRRIRQAEPFDEEVFGKRIAASLARP
jgi:hypothetical protein